MRPQHGRWLLPLGLVAAGLILLIVYFVLPGDNGAPLAQPEPANTPLPIPPAAPTATESATLTPVPTATAVPPTIAPPASPTPTIIPTATPPQPFLHRVGVSGAMADVPRALAAGLPFHHYLNWNIHPNPAQPEGVTFWQMVRLNEAGIRQPWEQVAEVAAAQPGAFWIVGNEPDIAVQDNVTAERYATIYHEVYTFVKERDPTAQIAIAAVGQPTPLRLAYLDNVLASYQEQFGAPMPIDVWTIHAFILREERDSWGVGIPTGRHEASGVLYEIEDHIDLEIFAANLIAFRAWMAERGYQDRPLAVTELGVLMPEDFGFPPPVVAEFLRGAYDFLLTAANETGYPADDYRLVQYSFWFILYDNEEYPTGNLYDRPNRRLTEVGRAFADYMNQSP